MHILFRRHSLTVVAAAAAFSACGAARPAGPDLTQPPASHDERMDWWREARFGMFIHWGLYAIPAGKWRDATSHGEWIRDTAHIPVDVYEQFRPAWNPTRFDADMWAKAAADAGMKYLVITSKHHDGFCLFDSQATDWDVANTPHGRDILRELSEACARHGVRFCTYHSIMDWHHPDYLPRRPWEAATRSADGADFDRFEKYLHTQVTEVVRGYRPAVMWFDGEWEPTWTHERGVRLFELCRSLAPGMIVNNRVDVHRGGMGGFSQTAEAVGDFATPEQEIPATGLPGVDWESCMTMNDHWGWNAADKSWKSTKELVHNLVDIASKGGNYLLNVGPRGDGTFPPEAVERLREIGVWMQRHGEAIHGTTASPFDGLSFGRCTVRAGGSATRLYLHVFDWPATGELVLPGLGSEPKRAFVLGDETIQLPVRRVGTSVHVAVPPTAPDPIASVVVLELADGNAPVVYKNPTITAATTEFVHDMPVTLLAAPGLEVRYTLDGSDPNTRSPVATAPVTVRETTTVKASTFHGGALVSGVAQRTFTKVTPLPPVKAVPRGAGVNVEAFAVDWQSIPDDRTSLTATKTWVQEGVGLASSPGERTAHRYIGFLEITEDEMHRFALASDDGSKLWIDGQLVVDNDGLHGTVEKQGAIALGKGLHAVELVWFNRTGDAALTLRWALPGRPFEAVPASAWKH